MIRNGSQIYDCETCSPFNVFLRTMKTYLITGAGSGMGRATAILLSAQAGTRIICIGRREAQLKETLSMMTPGPHRLVDLDCRDAQALRKSFANDEFIGQHGLDGVFANAGVGGENHYGKDDRWDEIISINLTGTYHTIMESLPYLRKSLSPFRHILMTSSCLARFGVPHYTAYCTAKTGLLGLTRSLAVELASEHILVNALCPGWVETEMAQAGIQKLADRAGASYEDELARQKSFVPLGRLSQPQEIAETVAFLFSNRQTSITGQAIDINNGSYMI
jgi:NAD(P)-dependent dehydrogenase (short-subunit alcohol dehydrogenase family)